MDGYVAVDHDAEHGVEGSHQLVSITREEASLDVLCAKARLSCCRVWREGKEHVLDQRDRRGRREGD